MDFPSLAINGGRIESRIHKASHPTRQTRVQNDTLGIGAIGKESPGTAASIDSAADVFESLDGS